MFILSVPPRLSPIRSVPPRFPWFFAQLVFSLWLFIVHSFVQNTLSDSLYQPHEGKMSWILLICLMNDDISYVSHHLEYRKEKLF